MEITNIKPLYRYENADDSISITPVQRNEDDTIHAYRLITDEGYELYHNGENQHCSVLDVFNISGWIQETIDIENTTHTYSEAEHPIEDYDQEGGMKDE